MRTSIASATFLLLGAGAAAVGAAPGDNIALNGSDTLFQVTKKVMQLCNGTSGPSNGDITGHGLTYVGGGSGTGAAQMDLQLQEVAPMSRALKNTEYCNNAAAVPPITTQSTTNALMIGIDGVSVMANSANACSPDLAKTGGNRSFTYGPSNTVYNITTSLDVLRLVYGGTDGGADGKTFTYTGDRGCAGPIRKALVANWNKLFNADCGAGINCPAEYTIGTADPVDVTQGLTHAWRRSDLSGTTDAFVGLVGFGSRKIGPNPSAPGAGGSGNPKTTNPFCNSVDATTGGTSFATASDYVDNDPIRVTCDDNDGVCGMNNNLGLVLPILLPDVDGVPTTDTYPTVDCDAGACGLSDTGDPNQPCPRGGPKKLGRCYQPYKLVGGVKNFQCRASLTASCFGDLGVDGRAYNLPLKQKQGSEGGVYLLDSNSLLMSNSFFRIHANKASTYAPAGAPTCNFADDTQQIGCLVNADPCSIGFAGREADAQAGNQALSVNGLIPKDPTGHPLDPDFYIENLLSGAGKCAADADCAGQAGGKTTCLTAFAQCYNTATNPVYPLSRRLYVASLIGFGNLQGGEKQLGLCFGDNNIVKQAISANNFVKVPAGVTCLDYPELNSSDPNTGFLPTCSGATAGGANPNACDAANPAHPTITN
jgi:ABC-type phosphate transport system substrate-binding protein